LTERLAAVLEAMTLQLYEILDPMRDLGLELISVQPQTGAGRPVDRDQTADGSAPPPK
jgi:hypothetical protein